MVPKFIGITEALALRDGFPAKDIATADKRGSAPNPAGFFILTALLFQSVFVSQGVSKTYELGKTCQV
jgi:hypothetical protein